MGRPAAARGARRPVAALMARIEVEIAEKRYPAVAGAPPRLALKGVSLALAAGEFTALVGPSGCGKTTLLNIIAGLDQAYAGRVLRPPRADGAAPRLGYVFQTPRLLPWRTVRENVRLVLRPDQDPAVADRLIEAVGLGEAAAIYPPRLSGGMARRAAIARAFAVEPDLLLMDEPFVSLDPDAADQLRQLLLGLWRARPTTILFVTHDLR